jgi:hypothetical protein
MRKSILFRLHSVLLILVFGAIASSTAFGNATITILNNDGPGVGFNDNTPAAPVGGNSWNNGRSATIECVHVCREHLGRDTQ